MGMGGGKHRNMSNPLRFRCGYVACFPPQTNAAEADLVLERHAATSQRVSAAIRFLPAEPKSEIGNPKPGDLVLLTNGIGGMARICVDLGV